MNRKRIAEHSKGMGRPLVGGPFSLTDHNGKPFTNEDMKGKYALVYFGFTHCPDICPEELDKMAGMIDRVKEKHGNVLLPVFITCDPARDTPEVTKEYLAEFHPDIVGLTGEYQQIKDTCKVYRVYFSTPADVKPGQDYLVDHSIYFYLMGEWLGGSAIWDVRLGASKADAIQIPMVILSKLSDAISPSKRRPRSSTTMFRTGGGRSIDRSGISPIRACIGHVSANASDRIVSILHGRRRERIVLYCTVLYVYCGEGSNKARHLQF